MSFSAARSMVSISFLSSTHGTLCNMCQARTPFKYPEIVLPEYAEARFATKAESKVCVAGDLPCSGIPFSSQKQCHISKPAPYDTRVSSSHAWSIVSFMRSRSSLLIPGVCVGPGEGMTGVHCLKRSLARQCGRRREGMGVRCCGYGAGPLVV